MKSISETSLFTVTPFRSYYEYVHRFAIEDARRHPFSDYFGNRAALHFFISSRGGGCIQLIIAVHHYGARFCSYVPLMENPPFVFAVIRFRHRINH